MKIQSIALLAAAGITLASFSAFAGHGMDCPEHKMPFPKELIDTDKNGTISADEMKKFHAIEFKKADTNNDGSIDAAEFNTKHQKDMQRRHEAMFKGLDSNGDGKLTAEEMNKKHQSHMATCDMDKNGDLSDQEIKTCQPMKHGKMHGMKGGAEPAAE